MRIVAGLAKGRKIKAPKGRETRPMTDRVREALFSILGDSVKGSRVLDLYAGSGSLGLEALSRGAGCVVFVEHSREAVNALRANVGSVDLGGEVVEEDVVTYLEAGPFQVDLAFVDPPYALPLASLEVILKKLAPGLASGATVIVHRRSGDHDPEVPQGMEQVDRRQYGDSVIWRMEAK